MADSDPASSEKPITSGSIAGKLMFGGEYAIVTGRAPAVAVAAGDLLRWRLVDTAPATLTLTAFDTTDTCPLAALEGRGLWQLARRVVEHLVGLGWRPVRSIDMHVAGHVGGRKLGLGTSAAVTVGLLHAAAADAGWPHDADWLVEQGMAAHGAAQGGRGSGYDIATVAHGGLIAYRRPPPQATPLPWPDGLFAAALWTGRPADTAAALRRGVQDDEAGMSAIGDCAETLLAAFESSDVGRILDALAGCEGAFTQLVSRHPHLLPPESKRLAAVISDAGAVTRSSGAGGGDCMLAFADDNEVIDRVVNRWRDEGGLCVARMPADIPRVEGR